MFKPTLSDDYTHIYSKDPAIDQTLPDYDPEKWGETGEAKYLPVKPGDEPVRFTLRHLRGRAKAVLTDRLAAEGHAQTFVEAVALALVRIENGQLDDGTPFQVGFTEDKRDRVRRCDDRTLDLLYSVDNAELIIELGNRVIRETFGNPT